MKAFLIPGSGEDLHSRDYPAVLEIYAKHGYEPQFIKINWKYAAYDSWLNDALHQVDRQDLSKSLLGGFSWGSMIALGLAARDNPARLQLYSLSPYFSEDMPLPPKYKRWVGKKRLASFSRLSFDYLASRVKCPTDIFLGSVEQAKYRDVAMRSAAAEKRVKNSHFILVEGASHNVGDPRYVEAIDKTLAIY